MADPVALIFSSLLQTYTELDVREISNELRLRQSIDFIFLTRRVHMEVCSAVAISHTSLLEFETLAYSGRIVREVPFGEKQILC